MLHSVPRVVVERLDHVVIGPAGVFSIDTKHHRGQSVGAGAAVLRVLRGPHESLRTPDGRIESRSCYLPTAFSGRAPISRDRRARDDDSDATIDVMQTDEPRAGRIAIRSLYARAGAASRPRSRPPATIEQMPSIEPHQEGTDCMRRSSGRAVVGMRGGFDGGRVAGRDPQHWSAKLGASTSGDRPGTQARGATRSAAARPASQTVPAGGQTPMMRPMMTSVTSSWAMLSPVSDHGRPSKASWVMNLAAVNPAHRISAVRSAASR